VRRIPVGCGLGELSAGTDARRHESASRPPAGYLPYGERKPYVVCDTLATLSGPTHGVVTLPHHIDWSGNAEYDLSQPGAWPAWHKVVLTEAATVSVADHYTYRVHWSAEDGEYIGTVAELPSVSWLAEDRLEAFVGVQRVVEEIVADMLVSGEEPLVRWVL
jgi:predicted RNase H-like HicB family nuclease